MGVEMGVRRNNFVSRAAEDQGLFRQARIFPMSERMRAVGDHVPRHWRVQDERLKFRNLHLF
jgi:hypothetical protein